MKRIAVSLVGLFWVGMVASNAFSWPVPDTGQTKCYDDEGNEINPCPGPGEPFYGQDGNYLINPPSYTKLDVDGDDLPESAAEWSMVRDNITGLIWEVKQNKDGVADYRHPWSDGNPGDSDNQYTWKDIYDPKGIPYGPSLGDFTSFLRLIYRGYWVSPTAEKLQSIVNYGNMGPSIDQSFFPNTYAAYYWSNIEASFNTDRAFRVSFDDGGIGTASMSSNLHARAVRYSSGSSKHFFVINGDGTVTDTSTGLMWQRESSPVGMVFEEALSRCESLVLSGFNDWRLPSVKELASILDRNRFEPAMDPIFQGHLDFPASRLWTSSSYISDSRNAWAVGFSAGSVGNVSKSSNCRFRAVRGGQLQKTGNLIILNPLQASKWNIDADMLINWDSAGISGNVAITLSRQGGQQGTYETIAASTPNDGSFEWTVNGAGTVNAALKIEPVSDSSRGTVQSLFSIVNNITIDPMGLTVAEPSGEATFTIKLNKAPATDVIIDLSTTNPGEFTLLDGSNNRTNDLTVTLDQTNWETGVDVTVRAEADNTPDGDQVSQVITSTVKSGDPDFSGLNIANVSVTVEDDQAGVYVDSIYPAYGAASEDLSAKIQGLGFADGATRVFIISPDGVETEVSPVTIDNAETLHITIPAPGAPVDYDLKVTNSDTETDTLKSAISFADAADIAAQRAKKAVIVAGGGPFLDNDLWTATRRNANQAYAALFGQGYDADSIQYLSPGFEDVTGDGENDVDDDANLASLENAITDWPVNTSPAATDLMIYLIGPGRTGEFLLKSTEGYEVALSASTLNGWLNTVQNDLAGDLIVIIDSPQAGSFLAPLADPDRVVIAGSSANERAWYLDDGEISFSWPFWDAVFNGGELLAAFDKADDLIGDVQTPAVDTDGNGLPDQRTRRTNLTEITVGRGRAVDTSPPSIGSVCSHATLPAGDTDHELWAGSVNADNGISQVWARIFPPMQSYQPGDRPVLTLPTLRLRYDELDDRYAELYEDFTENGTYKVLIHATDKREFQSIPKMVRVTQTEGPGLETGDLNADGTVGLADVMVALKAAAGMSVFNTAHIEPTGDKRIGVEDALYLLQRVSGVR